MFRPPGDLKISASEIVLKGGFKPLMQLLGFLLVD